MSAHPSGLRPFYDGAAAAAELGMPTDRLIAILKKHRDVLTFTDLSVKGNLTPWGKGRKEWGLTRDQMIAFLDLRRRQMPAEDGDTEEKKRAARAVQLKAERWPDLYPAKKPRAKVTRPGA